MAKILIYFEMTAGKSIEHKTAYNRPFVKFNKSSLNQLNFAGRTEI